MKENIFKGKTLLHYFALSGILAVIFYFLHDLLGSLAYPDYDFLSQAVSDLTALDAPSRLIAGGLSSVYGTFSVIASMVMVPLANKNYHKVLRLGIYLFAAMNLISNIGYSLFPLSSSGYVGTFQDIMHVYVVTALVVLLSIASLILIAIGGFKQNGKFRSLAMCAIVALFFMMAGAILSNLVDPSLFGLVERFSTYSAVIFTGVLGVYGFLLFNKFEH